MPLTTPIAASPQSNVFTERTTMVEVPETAHRVPAPQPCRRAAWLDALHRQTPLLPGHVHRPDRPAAWRVALHR